MNKTKHPRVIAFLAVLSLIFGGITPAIGQVASAGFVSPLSVSGMDEIVLEKSGHCDDHMQESLSEVSIAKAKVASTSSSNINNTVTVGDCCEDVCLCSQGGCQQSLNIASWDALGAPNLSDHALILSMSLYQTPSFENSNPPPIS